MRETVISFIHFLVLALLINGCDKKSRVCIPAIVNANMNFVVLERIKGDGTKNLHNDYDSLMGTNYKKTIIDNGRLIYTYQNKSPTESYKNIVIVESGEKKVEDFFCFWVDYRKKELMYLVAPQKYVKLIDKTQWGSQQSDKQIQNKIMNFIDSKEFSPKKLKQRKMFYHDLDRGEVCNDNGRI